MLDVLTTCVQMTMVFGFMVVNRGEISALSVIPIHVRSEPLEGEPTANSYVLDECGQTIQFAIVQHVFEGREA